MKLLFIFVDGVGLGRDDATVNPFVRANLPRLDDLLEGRKLIAGASNSGHAEAATPLHTYHLTLIPLDARLGVEGLPQSASGQASLLTGKNVPMLIGNHDGPKPNAAVSAILQQGTIFSEAIARNQPAALLNAYPERYFKSIESGHRLPGVFALAALYAGLHLRTAEDLYRGEALSVDLTGNGWRSQLNLPDSPVLTPIQAGAQLNRLATQHALSVFEYWLSDVAGHRQDMDSACQLLRVFDTTLGELADRWDGDEGLILVTSDHGNIEDLGTRHHTLNDVPLVLIGSHSLRQTFVEEMDKARGARAKFDLTDIASAIMDCLA